MNEDKTGGGGYLQFFDDALIELNKEVKHHPQLMELLSEFPFEEKGQRIACIAAYCHIVVDTYLNDAGLNKLASLLVDELKAKRAIIISNPGS